MDRNTAECFSACLQEVTQRPEIVQATFPERRLRVVTCDDAGANGREGRAFTRDNPGWVNARMSCQVHKCAAVGTKCGDLVGDDVTGVLNAMLSLTQVGQMRAFRVELASLVTEQLEVLYCPPDLTESESRHQRAVLDTFCGALSPKKLSTQWKRHVFQTLCNGKISTRGKVIHHCGVNCCRDREHTLQKFIRHLVPALLAGLKVFSRGKWTGSEEVYDSVCLAECHHFLFSQAFVRFAMARMRPGDASLGDGNDHLGADAIVPLDGVLAPASEDHWKRVSSAWLRTAVAWVESDWLPRLVALRLVNSGRRATLQRMLQTSSHHWERAQELRQVRTGSREYRALLRHKGWYTDCAMHVYGQLGTSADHSNAFPSAVRTSHARSLLFRLTARAAATMHELLVLPQRKVPFALFALLETDDAQEEERLMRQILATPACVLNHCEWAKSYVELYDTVEKMQSPPARVELKTIAHVMEICIARLESKHSRVRRLVKMLALQTHSAELESVSANFVGVHVRQSQEARLNVELAETDGGKKKRRAYSAWNVFMHEKGLQGHVAGEPRRSLEPSVYGEASSAAAVEYANLPDEEKKRLARKAALATARLRDGGLPFGDVSNQKTRRPRRQQQCLHAALRLGDDEAHGAGDGIGQLVALDQSDLENAILPHGDLTMDLDATRRKVWSWRRALSTAERAQRECDKKERMEFADDSKKAALAELLPNAKVFPDAYLPAPSFNIDGIPMVIAEQQVGAAADTVVAAMSSAASDMKKVKESLEEWWSHKHRLIEHSTQPDLGKVKVTASACSILGTCVCKEPYSRREAWSPEAVAMAFATELAKHAIARAPYVGDEFKHVVDKGFQVLSLTDDNFSERKWMHTSLVYYKRRPTFWLCEGPQDENVENHCLIRPRYHEDGSPMICSNFHLALREIDTSKKWTLSFFRLAPSDAPLLDVVPREVEVVKEAQCADVVVWPPPERGGGQGRGRGRGGGRGRAHGLEGRGRGRGRGGARGGRAGFAALADEDSADSDDNDDDMNAGGGDSGSHGLDNDDEPEEPVEQWLIDADGQDDEVARDSDEFELEEELDQIIQGGMDPDEGAPELEESLPEQQLFAEAAAESSDSDSDSYSSTSSSSDIDDSEENDNDGDASMPPSPPAQRAPRQRHSGDAVPAMRVRGPPLEAFHFPGGYLKVKIQDSTVCAHCTHPAHGGPNKCRRTRSLNFNACRLGQGLPLGHLIAWLALGHEGVDAEIHRNYRRVPSYDQRASGRALLLETIAGDPRYQVLADAEDGGPDSVKPFQEPAQVL